MKYSFFYNEKLGIKTPELHVEFEEMLPSEQDELLTKARKEAAKIPDRIKQFEEIYMQTYNDLENYPERFFELMDQLNELSAIIFELNIWFYKIEGKFLQQD